MDHDAEGEAAVPAQQAGGQTYKILNENPYQSNPTRNWFSVNWFLYLALILFADSISSRVLVIIRLQQKPFYFLGVGLLNIILSVSLNFRAKTPFFITTAGHMFGTGHLVKIKEIKTYLSSN